MMVNATRHIDASFRRLPTTRRVSDDRPICERLEWRRLLSAGDAGDDTAARASPTADNHSAVTLLPNPDIGPDSFGYAAFATSMEPIDLAPADGAVLTLIDNARLRSVPLDLGTNTFTLYGQTYSGTALWVSTSGLITVGPIQPGPATNLQRGIDTATIAPLWADWATDDNDHDAVLRRFDDTNADGAADRVVVEWDRVRTPGYFARSVTFQAILQLNTGPAAGEITFQYPSTGSGPASQPFSVTGIKDFGRPPPHLLVAQYHDLTSPFVGSGTALTIRRVVVPAEVVDRHLFYNNSVFDGRRAGADAGDDAAIATLTTAAVPGASATHDEVSGYGRGINGIMVDVRDLPPGELSADDFVFRQGMPSNVNLWEDAPAPQSVTVRRGAGTDGSDRVTLIWPDGAIRNTWLQVTVLANERTGLSAHAVFYFGSLVGNVDAPGSPYPSQVKVAYDDLVYVRRARHTGAAGLDNAFDLNRDGAVNVLDEALVRRNYGRTLPDFSLITETAPFVTSTPSQRPTSPTRRRSVYRPIG
jgi:hypothetical protein